jgi:hypothetical protein
MFDSYHAWVNYDSMLEKFRVGYLVPDGPANDAKTTPSSTPINADNTGVADDSLPLKPLLNPSKPAGKSLGLPMGVAISGSFGGKLPKGGDQSAPTQQTENDTPAVSINFSVANADEESAVTVMTVTPASNQSSGSTASAVSPVKTPSSLLPTRDWHQTNNEVVLTTYCRNKKLRKECVVARVDKDRVSLQAVMTHGLYNLEFKPEHALTEMVSVRVHVGVLYVTFTKATSGKL